MPQPSEETRGFVFNHTMLRVKDISKSLDFYSHILGFSLIDQRDFSEAQFSLYFLALLPDTVHIPDNDTQRRLWISNLSGVLELTHNYSTETQEAPVYHNGNSDPLGFGHICISVPNLYSACARFDALQIPYQKRLTDGRMKDIAFIKDPDGYWIEIISNTPRP
ncbi:MAG TPA: lactoylglutathione lyase [Xylella sp.]